MKSVEVVTFPSTGFFSKHLMRLVLTTGMGWSGELNTECKDGVASSWPPGLVLSSLCLELVGLFLEPLLLSIGPHCLGLCPAGGLRVQS